MEAVGESPGIVNFNIYALDSPPSFKHPTAGKPGNSYKARFGGGNHNHVIQVLRAPRSPRYQQSTSYVVILCSSIL